jgi:hypothetical protein
MSCDGWNGLWGDWSRFLGYQPWLFPPGSIEAYAI